MACEHYYRCSELRDPPGFIEESPVRPYATLKLYSVALVRAVCSCELPVAVLGLLQPLLIAELRL